MTRTAKDMIGKRFEKITVVGYSHYIKGKGHFYICKCECGNITTVATNVLNAKRYKSCGCINKSRFIDITNKKFGKLTVVRQTEVLGCKRAYKWLCHCECGNTHIANSRDLRIGKTKSCGCLQIEVIRERSITHGHTILDYSTITYSTWCSMLNRCYGENPTESTKRIYQDRGIIVCDRWRYSFENFLNDMGERPSKKHSIDRIDTFGNYEPGNCRWATAKQQGNNRVNNTVLDFNGKQLTLSEWEEETGISQKTLSNRLRLGWSIEKILTKPVR